MTDVHSARSRVPPDSLRFARDRISSVIPLRSAPVWTLLVGEIVVFALLQPVFRTSGNAQSVLMSVAALWVVAIPMTFVLITGGLDLSVGAIAATAGYLAAKLMADMYAGGVVVLATVAAGAAIGALVNGVFAGYLRLPVFVVTLASMTALTGGLELWANATSIYVNAPLAVHLSDDKPLGIPLLVWIMAAVGLAAAFIQNFTYLGRDIFAIGGSMKAAELSGIRSGRTLMWVYGAVGASAGFAGLIAVSRGGAASPDVDQGLPLQAIAAVLLGGTLISGGVGGVAGTAGGVLFLGVLQNGLSLSGVPASWQQVVTGLILIIAVLGGRVDMTRLRHRAAGTARRDAHGRNPERNHQLGSH